MKIIQPNVFLYFFLLVLAFSGFVFPVLWPNFVGFYAFIIVMSVGGFGVASYIFYTKKGNKQLVCPVGSDCNAVVNSKYAKFLGVPLEYGGMAYYFIIALSYLCLIFAPHYYNELMRLGLFLLTSAAFLFSGYLLFVQAFLLRQWCIWCMLSAALSITIFITALSSASYAVTFLMGIGPAIELIRTFGFGLGLGAVTVSLFLFFRFLKDKKIDGEEMHTLKGTSEIILLGLVLVLITQFINFVIDPKALSQSSTFLVQMIALFVSGVSGAALMIIFDPLLNMIPFAGDESAESKSPLSVLTRPFFVTSAIAVSSWYFAFVVDYISNPNFLVLLVAYFVVLLLSMGAALVLEGRGR